MSGADLAEILSLPPQERLRLLELLWESLSAAPENVPLSRAHREALDEAIAEHRLDPENVLTFEEVVAGVRSSQ